MNLSFRKRETKVKEKLLVLLKSCLSSSGRILKSKNGDGVNLFGISKDFKISALSESLEPFGLTASHFEEKKVAPSKEGDDWTIKPELVYVGKPQDISSDKLGDIFGLE